MKAIHLLAAACIAVTFGARAQTASAPTGTASTQGPSRVAMTDGEVRKVDKEQGKVTLRHGPIQNLEMPGMTMVFKVADPKMLDKLKEGDRVRFSTDRVGGAITVTNIQLAN